MPLLPQKPEFYRDVFLDDMPGGKCRIKPDLIPGIAAYLIMLADQYAEVEQRLHQQRCDKNDKWEEGLTIHLKKMQECLAMILKQLPNKFNRRIYNDMFNGVMDDFHINQSENLELLDSSPNDYPGVEGK